MSIAVGRKTVGRTARGILCAAVTAARRFMPVAIVAVVSTVTYYGCSDNPVDTTGEVGSRLKDGHRALKEQKYDEALAYYEQAYAADNNDPEAIIYSTLAKLASVSIDPKVVNLYKNRFGFTNYPNRLNAQLSADWLVTYPTGYIEWSYYDESGKYVRWFDEWDVNRYNSWYPEYGINRVGYYYDDYSYVLVSETYIGEDYYYDSESGEYAYWINKSEIRYYGVPKEGYYVEKQEFSFVSDVPHYGEYKLPELIAPSWVKGGSNSLYNGTLFNGAPSIETYPLLLLANVLDKNTSGLNGLLDETIDAVFGSSSPFNEACNRIKKLENTKATIKLDREFLDAVYLSDFVDEYDVIGWAEVNALTSFMTGIKASLQWLASYNWDTDLSFLKFAWTDNEDDFYNKLKTVSVNNLPFGNNFLKTRPGKMADAKTNFVKAIEGIKASYNAILTSDLYPPEVKDAYPTLSQGADRLIAAIQNGGVFYIPDDPTRGNWPTSGKGINMGKLFTEGYFSLQNLFETDGEKPVFYAEIALDIGDYELFSYDLKLTKDNYGVGLSDVISLIPGIPSFVGIVVGFFDIDVPIGRMLYEAADIPIGLKLKADHVASVFIDPSSGKVEDEVAYMFSPRYGALLFEKFYGINPLFKARPVPPLAGARLRK